MPNKKMLFVYNPHAGKAKIRTQLSDILDVFALGEYEITIAPTQKQADAIDIVRLRAADYDVVVCSGGDGTLDETVTGMMKSGTRTTIGYIPAGSTNDFGSSLALPKDMIRAAKIIVDGKKFAIDVGQFNDNVFVYIAAFGLFTEVTYSTDQQIKNLIGHSAYIFEGAKSLLKVHSHKMRVSWDDQVAEGEFIYGMITNSTSVGGFKGITGKEVLLDDGEFEVTLIKVPRNVVELNMILIALINRNIVTELMYSFRASRIVFESEEEVAWTLDGEAGGAHKMVEINNLPKAIDICVAE